MIVQSVDYFMSYSYLILQVQLKILKALIFLKLNKSGVKISGCIRTVKDLSANYKELYKELC